MACECLGVCACMYEVFTAKPKAIPPYEWFFLLVSFLLGGQLCVQSIVPFVSSVE